ncbi:MAG: hypothetical protein ACFFKA_10220 [Candidatus Thorarchaeota archaeon]
MINFDRFYLKISSAKNVKFTAKNKIFLALTTIFMAGIVSGFILNKNNLFYNINDITFPARINEDFSVLTDVKTIVQFFFFVSYSFYIV